MAYWKTIEIRRLEIRFSVLYTWRSQWRSENRIKPPKCRHTGNCITSCLENTEEMTFGKKNQTCFTLICSRVCRGISAPVPGAPPLLLLRWPGCLQGCFSHFFLTPLSHRCCTMFFTLSQTCFPYHLAEELSCVLWWVCWSRLEPSVSGMGQPQTLLTEATLQHPCYRHLAMDTQYTNSYRKKF